MGGSMEDTTNVGAYGHTPLENGHTPLPETVGESEPIRTAGQIMAAKEGDATGYKWSVRVAAFGVDLNGNYWDRAVMTAAVAKFEGAKVFALQEAQHQAKPHRYGKSVLDMVGVLSNVTAAADGIYADLTILPAAVWLRDNLVGCDESGMSNVLGLSVDVGGEVGTKIMGAKRLPMMTKINNVTVDVVYDPVARGEFLAMKAAMQTETKEKRPMIKTLLTGLARRNKPEADRIQAAIDSGSITDDQAFVQAFTALEVRNDESLQAGKDQLKEMKLVTCGMQLTTELQESKLPFAAQEYIRAAYEGKIFEITDLQAGIKSTKEMLDKMTASGAVSGAGDARVTGDSVDKAKAYLDDFFSGDKGVHSFKAAYQDITGDTRMSGDLRDASNMKAAVTSVTFDQILGDSIARRMVEEYNLAQLDDWRKITNIVPLSDFRTQRRPRLGGYGNLPAVAQSGAYAALTTPADEEATYAASKRGGTESVTLEAIRNDDVGAIRRIPVKLGRAAARTLYVFVFDFLNANPTIYDSVALFHATHANLGVTALTKATLQAGRLQMMKQPELTSAEVMGIPPRYLITPPDLEDTGFELTAVAAAGLFTPTAPDAVRRMTYETISVRTWTDINNWYLAADPKDIPSIEIGFLDGKETPELFVQDLPNIGNMFSNDQLTYKIRHIYGGCVTDYRGLQGNVVP